jgi:hypothetical protein
MKNIVESNYNPEIKFQKNQKVIDGTIKITSPLVIQAGRDV